MKFREKIPHQPSWDSRFIGWAAKFIWKNMWRCEGNDPEEKFKDLMQDAYITFRHILASYPLVTEPNHIMSLFQRAMENEFHDKAKYKQRKQAAEISLETIISEDLKLIDSLGECNNEGYLRLILSELPPEVRAVLDAFNDEEKLALIRQPRVQSRLAKLLGLPLKRETFNSTLWRVLRLPNLTNIVGLLRDALKP